MNSRLVTTGFFTGVFLIAACAPAPAPVTVVPAATLAPEALQQAIFTAAQTDDTEAMRAHIAGGADINGPNDYGATVLAIATQRDNYEMVRLLLESGAQVRAVVFHNAVARSGDDTDRIQLFLDHGAPIDEAATGLPGHTALMYAAEHGHVEVGKLLLDNGADINIGDYFGDPAINVAAFYGQLAFLKMLVERGAELNVPGRNRFTALSHAVSRGHTEVAEYLLSVGGEE
jgi:ankyrin repeat protein